MNISKKMSLIVTLSVLLVSFISLWSFYTYSRNLLLSSTLSEIQSSSQEKSQHYQALIQGADHNLKTLAHLLNRVLTQPNYQSDIAFEQRMMQFEDGAWRNKMQLYNGAEQTGLFLPSDINLTAETKQFYSKLVEVVNDFGAAATANPFFDNIWLAGQDRSHLVFDLSSPDFVYLIDATNEYANNDDYASVSKQAIDSHRSQWLPLFMDPITETWMAQVVYPITLSDKWQATIGANLKLDTLFAFIKSSNSSYKEQQHVLLDEKGALLAANSWQGQSGEDLAQLSPMLNKLWNKSLNKDISYIGTVDYQGKDYEVVSQIIKPMGWKYFRLVSTDEILQPLLDKMKNVVVLIIFMAVLLAVAIRAAISHLVVKPLVELTARARNYILGNKPSEVMPVANDEMAELEQVFESLEHALTADNMQLLNSERRYRQVITSINQALVQVDKQHQWQFLSPIWKKISGYELYNAINRDVVHFLHPSDRELITKILESLFDGQLVSWNGDVRLKTQSNRYIWVSLSLRLNHMTDKEQSDSVVSGTLENIHMNHITQEITKLLRTAEQMVLTSDCSVTTLLKYVTQTLVKIIDIPLVWVKICKDFEGQILSESGPLADFLYDTEGLWAGLHREDSPVILAVREHVITRVLTTDTNLSEEWRLRLQNDEIKDSLFLPFFLAGGDTQAAIGLHSNIEGTFDNQFQALMSDFSSGLRLICQMAEDQYLMRLHRTALEKTANAIMITDKYGTIEWVNDAFVKQTLFRFDDVRGKKPSVLNANTPESADLIAEMWRVVKSGRAWSGELENRRKDASLISVYLTVTPLMDDLGDITHYISVSEDITERKESELRIAFMATHDELTQLPNRNLLNDRINHGIAHAKRQNSMMAILFIDIDHFKFINDSLGHQVGDELLKTLANRLRAVLRQVDTVSRFGGDEFVVILPEIFALQSVNSIVNNLLDEIKKPYDIMEHELIITGSIGISIYPDNADTADNLIQHADSAMYSAKELGRNNYQFYTAEINEKINRRLVLEKALRQALDLEQFILHYQPKVNLKTGKITGMEALIRWQHPDLGLISPIEFIPLAEETGIIIEIGHWVMMNACAQMKAWEAVYPTLINMSINVSARQFWQADFMRNIELVFSETNVSKEKIEFELTESIVMKDVTLATSMMSKLKSFGISLSIDDFGTGYSSLSYLQNFPVDVLKIDRSFVNDLKDEKSDSAIVRSIIALANNFNLQVVAEGIEDEFQKEILTDLGCQYGQGYYFSRPVTADEMAVLLDQQ